MIEEIHATNMLKILKEVEGDRGTTKYYFASRSEAAPNQESTIHDFVELLARIKLPTGCTLSDEPTTHTPPAGTTKIAEWPVGAIYDDSHQIQLVAIDKRTPFGLVYRVYEPKMRALRHVLYLRVYAPNLPTLIDSAQGCLGTAVVGAAVGALAAGVGAVKGFEVAFLACMGDKAADIILSLDDESHWTDWG